MLFNQQKDYVLTSIFSDFCLRNTKILALELIKNLRYLFYTPPRKSSAYLLSNKC